MLNFMKREKIDGPAKLDTTSAARRSVSPQRSPKSKNHYTGVGLEPEVIAYLDNLALRMRMNRSWVLNTIVHEYAKLVEKKNLIPLSSREDIIRL